MYAPFFASREWKKMATRHIIFLLLVLVGYVTAQCGNGIVDLGEDCDLGVANGASSSCCAADCTYQPSTRQCRLPAGPCDAPEMCTGAQATCPPDLYRPNTFACRPAEDICDQVEYCTGLSVACPANTYRNSSTVCRQSEGDCDPSEFCTGLSPACPLNVYLPNTELCREQEGACDVPEYCTGSTPTCPADARVANGTVCRSRLGRCDRVEHCDGVSVDCPVDAFEPNTTECRASEGDCDPPEFCPGNGADCPANVYAPSSQECRGADGPCDRAENCTGIGPLCPVDAFLDASVVCDPAIADCDLDTHCSGNGAACPAKRYRSAGEECRAAQGDCDVPEVCLGEGEAYCPADVRLNASTVCRQAKSECDQEERCQGDVSCPPDAFTNSSYVCRPVEGDCDLEETCTGDSPFCPPNKLKSIYDVCGVQNPSQTQCTFTTVCTGLSAQCPSTIAKDGIECTVDGNLCYKDVCANGTCARGPQLVFDDGLYCNGAEQCDPDTGLKVPGIPINCEDGNSCTYNTCDEGSDSCTTSPKPGTTGSCYFGQGGCLAGSYACDGSGPEPVIWCSGAVAPTPEVCGDGIDNNCDFQVDEYCSLHACSVDADCADIDIGPCDIIACTLSTCTVTKKPVGTVCDYFKLGQYNGTCNAVGLCEATPIQCDDGNPCTLDSFSAALRACLFDPAPLAGSQCTPDDPQAVIGMCTEQGVCASILSNECPESTPDLCVEFFFNETSLACDERVRYGSCDDGDLCTRHDTCLDGQCVGAQTVCNDDLWCTTDVCTPATGECMYTLPPGYCYIDGKCYSDGDFNEYCPCSVCNSTESQIEWSFTYAQNACDDADPCTHSDACDVYTHTCVGIPLDCSAGDSACTMGVCRLGQCETVAVREDQTCDDGDGCTIDDKCRRGVCAGSTFDYQTPTQQCLISSCVNGTIQSTPASDYLACNVDADTCLGVYYCLNGSCISDGPLVCPPSNNSCTENVCETGYGCVELPLSGQACDDNNVCTIGDSCGTNGNCVPGGITLDCDDLNPCTDDFCLPDVGCVHIPIASCTSCSYTEDCSPQLCHQAYCISGSCVYFAQQAGTSCSDGDICNGREVCAGNGVCVNEGALNCDDGNPCTDDTCQNNVGCVHTVNTLNSCSDMNACTTGDQCNANGECVGVSSACPPSTRCAEYSCAIVDNNATCIKYARNVGSWCDSNDSCIHSAVCSEYGECVGVPVECPSPSECIAAYSCANGVCTPSYTSIGTPCNLNNLCTESLCNGAGECVEMQPIVNCSAPDQCRLDGVCVPQTGECIYPLAADDTPCDDSNACTAVDKCKYGECVGYEPTVCENINQCHGQGVCDTLTGLCSNPWLPNFTPCTDSSACTETSVCIFGSCVGTGTLECAPSPNQCLTPRCDPNQGCLYDFSTAACDDNNLCTVGETCLEGSCAGGTPVNCSHQSTCGLTYCSPSLGCLPPTHEYCDVCIVDTDCPYFPCKNGTCQNGVCAYTNQDDALFGCNDLNFCNGQEFCHAGTCILGVPPSCDDHNECTVDTCANDQCIHTPTPNITCMNGDMCATNAQCDGEGHCLSVSRIECEDVDECLMSLGCNAESGACEYEAKADGSPCSDDNLCTVESICLSGVCNAVKLRNCSSDYSCERDGVCDVFTGKCLEPSSCDVRSCDDGLLCTLGDLCADGECRPGVYSVCDALPHDRQCQIPTCLANGTCAIENAADQTPCELDIPRGVCSGRDVCLSGTCTRTYAAGVLCRPETPGGCDVADVCIDNYDHCPEDVRRPNNVSCPSILYCLESQCFYGVCVPRVPRDCSAYDSECSVGVCDERSRTCVGRNLPDDTSCVSGEENQCTPFSRCLTGVCTPYYANELTLCDDGDLCTRDSFCSGYDGTCTTGVPLDCTHLDSSCGTGFCDTLTGTCQAQSINEGASCNADNDACTPNDFCHLGLCIQDTPVDCSYLDSPCQHGECVDGSCAVVIDGPECEPDYCAGGCTVPFQWWSLHNSKCKSRSKRFRWPDDLENARLCGQTYYQWSQKRARNAWRMLMHQWMAVILNEANGACVPPEIQADAADAFNLLIQCDMSINVTGVPGRPYRQLASSLYSYTTGTKGPGTCLRPSCARQSSTSYFSCLFPQLQSRDIVVDEDISQLDCARGIWDYVSDVCDCELGWSGPTCAECGIPDEEDHTFLCVPLVGEEGQYILRSIPDDELYMYINEDVTQLRHMLQITNRMAVYPGTGSVDCACNLVDAPLIDARSTTGVIVYGDITVYVTEIERNLQDCEQVFDVVVYNNNLDCDPNTTDTTIIIENGQSNCSAPDDWNYICDCCLEDDDDCACPKNDIMCLRNHLIKNHERKELYELLTVIFMALTGLFFILLFGYYINRRNARRAKEKEERSDETSQSIFLAASRQKPISFNINSRWKKKNRD